MSSLSVFPVRGNIGWRDVSQLLEIPGQARNEERGWRGGAVMMSRFSAFPFPEGQVPISRGSAGRS